MNRREQVFAQAGNDRFWADAPDWAHDELRECHRSIQQQISQANTAVKSLSGARKKDAAKRRAELIADLNKVAARLSKLRAAQAKGREWTNEARDLLDGVKQLIVRNSDLEGAIADHRRNTLADEIDPGPYDLELWAYIDRKED